MLHWHAMTVNFRAVTMKKDKTDDLWSAVRPFLFVLWFIYPISSRSLGRFWLIWKFLNASQVWMFEFFEINMTLPFGLVHILDIYLMKYWIRKHMFLSDLWLTRSLSLFPEIVKYMSDYSQIHVVLKSEIRFPTLNTQQFLIIKRYVWT